MANGQYNLVFQIESDARRYVNSAAGMTKLTRSMADAQAALEAQGLRTTESYRKQHVELARLAREFKNDKIAMGQVVAEQARLNNEMKESIRLYNNLSAATIRHAQTAGRDTFTGPRGENLSIGQVQGATEQDLARFGIKTAEAFAEEKRQLDLLIASRRHDIVTVNQALALKQDLIRQEEYYTKSLSEMERTNRRASFALFNMSAIIQDAPYGFRAIANNIEQTVYAMVLLKESLPEGTTMLKAMTGALLSPTGVVVGLAVATAAVVAFEDELTDLLQKKEKDLAQFRESFKKAFQQSITIVGRDQGRTFGLTVEQLRAAVKYQQELVTAQENALAVRKAEIQLQAQQGPFLVAGIASTGNLLDLETKRLAVNTTVRDVLQETLMFQDAFAAAQAAAIQAGGTDQETMLQEQLRRQKEIAAQTEEIIFNGVERIAQLQVENDNNERLNQLQIERIRLQLEMSSGITAEVIAVELQNDKYEDQIKLMKERAFYSDFIKNNEEERVVAMELEREAMEREMTLLKEQVKTREYLANNAALAEEVALQEHLTEQTKKERQDVIDLIKFKERNADVTAVQVVQTAEQVEMQRRAVEQQKTMVDWVQKEQKKRDDILSGLKQIADSELKTERKPGSLETGKDFGEDLKMQYTDIYESISFVMQRTAEEHRRQLREMKMSQSDWLFGTIQGLATLEEMWSVTMGGITDLYMQAIGGDLDKANKRYVRMWGRIAIAQAIGDTYVAANKALSGAPPPFNYIMVAGVIAAGLANVMKIRRQVAEAGGGSGGSGGGASITYTNRAYESWEDRSDRNAGLGNMAVHSSAGVSDATTSQALKQVADAVTAIASSKIETAKIDVRNREFFLTVKRETTLDRRVSIGDGV